MARAENNTFCSEASEIDENIQDVQEREILELTRKVESPKLEIHLQPV
jgi:hypothetical protein